MTEQVERDGYDQFWDVVESAPVHHGHIVQPLDALRSAWLVRDLTEDDFRTARTATAAMQKDAAMDRIVSEGQRCDAMTPQEAAKVSAEDRENIVDEIESIICETHEMDVRDIDYAENIVSWLERHHPAALRAISGMPDTTQQSSGADGNREPIMWAVEKWRDEVQNRPLHNVLRRTLDDTWRTVMRKFGGNPEELVGPSHDDLVATAAEATP